MTVSCLWLLRPVCIHERSEEQKYHKFYKYALLELETPDIRKI